jgi:hypothetical protein
VEQLLLRADGGGGYIVLNAESEDDARRYLDGLPFVQTVDHALRAHRDQSLSR